MHWSWQTPSSNNTREDSTHGHHQRVNTEIRLIIFFAANDGAALYSQQNKTGSWLWLRSWTPRSKHLLISWLRSSSTVILEPKIVNSATVSIVSSSICLKWWDWMPWSLFFEFWVLSLLFHSPLSPSSIGSLVPLNFLPCGCCHLHIWVYWYFSLQSWFSDITIYQRLTVCQLPEKHQLSYLLLS